MGVLINLGSGQRPFQKPWVNVDCQERWTPDVLCTPEEPLLKFDQASADMIVLHHVIEHIGCGEADGMLEDCVYTLEPGGSLLVFVPDMWKIATMWREGRLSTQVYLTNVYGAYMGHDADRHRWGYTKETLKELLLSVGFRTVKEFDWRHIPGADIARDDRWILGMEGIK